MKIRKNRLENIFGSVRSISDEVGKEVVTFVIITGASIIDRENQACFRLIVKDTCSCDLPLIRTLEVDMDEF